MTIYGGSKRERQKNKYVALINKRYNSNKLIILNKNNNTM